MTNFRLFLYSAVVLGAFPFMPVGGDTMAMLVVNAMLLFALLLGMAKFRSSFAFRKAVTWAAPLAVLLTLAPFGAWFVVVGLAGAMYCIGAIIVMMSCKFEENANA